jgi:hypothetical protein
VGPQPDGGPPAAYRRFRASLDRFAKARTRRGYTAALPFRREECRIGSFLPRAVLLGVFLLPTAARADGPAVAPTAPPKVTLDQLLKLPDTVEYTSELKGGATPDEWRKRFREARADLEHARAALEQSLAEMHESGDSGAWKVAPPGLGNVTNNSTSGEDAAPSNYQLSMEIKRQRGEVRRAEQALSDLEVEANLAGVPDDWRR